MKLSYQRGGIPVLFHWCGWHGKDGAPSLTGYISTDPNVIGSQLDAMEVLGGNKAGVIALTFGPTVSPFIHEACMEMCRQCNERRKPFALCLNPWSTDAAISQLGPMVSTTAKAAAADAAMVTALKHPDMQWMLNSRSYIAGRPVLQFDTGCTVAGIVAGVPNVTPWFKDVDFAWPKIGSATNNNVKLPCLALQFNDGTGADRNKSAWDQTKPVRTLEARAGSLYWDFSDGVPAGATYVQFVTWNDVKEGTDVEKFAALISSRIG